MLDSSQETVGGQTKWEIINPVLKKGDVNATHANNDDSVVPRAFKPMNLSIYDKFNSNFNIVQYTVSYNVIDANYHVVKIFLLSLINMVEFFFIKKKNLNISTRRFSSAV